MSWLVISFKSWIPVISPFIGAILGLLLIDNFNIFDYLLFVPAEKKFDIGITVYFAIIEVITNRFLNFVTDKIAQFKSTLEVIISLPNTTPDLQVIPQVIFKEQETLCFMVTFKLFGKRKHFCDAKVKIPDIRFATLQPAIKYDGISIKNNEIIVDLSYLAGASNFVEVEHEYKFVLQKDLPNGKHSEKLSPVIYGKKITCKYNQIQIIMEE